jgi:hypothetical protein
MPADGNEMTIPAFRAIAAETSSLSDVAISQNP